MGESKQMSINTGPKLAAVEKRAPDTMVLPSGTNIDVDRPDFSLIKSEDDFVELKYALQEKIIDIELQIDLFTTGAGVMRGHRYALDWLPRANAALKWAKLYRDECQNRAGMMNRKAKAARQGTVDAHFIAVAKARLSSEEFDQILAEARLMENTP